TTPIPTSVIDEIFVPPTDPIVSGVPTVPGTIGIATELPKFERVPETPKPIPLTPKPEARP
ncbi:MAG: hypothetical protein ABI995_05185, partial [Acidobacteriota bacterium]